MGFTTETVVAHTRNRLAASAAKFMTRLVNHVRGFIAARKRRAEQDRAFYRDLKAYCRANNLSPVCEDDWKTGA